MVISECGLFSPIRPATVQIHPSPETTSIQPRPNHVTLPTDCLTPLPPISDETNWPPVMSPIVALIKTPLIGSSERYVKVAGNREEVRHYQL